MNDRDVQLPGSEEAASRGRPSTSFSWQLRVPPLALPPSRVGPGYSLLGAPSFGHLPQGRSASPALLKRLATAFSPFLAARPWTPEYVRRQGACAYCSLPC